jgi:hypothetical protein
MGKGFRRHVFKCDPVDFPRVIDRVNKFDFVMPEKTKEVVGGIAFTMELATLPSGDGPAAELMVRRELELVVALKTYR